MKQMQNAECGMKPTSKEFRFHLPNDMIHLFFRDGNEE